jgi:hypothetical protein
VSFALTAPIASVIGVRATLIWAGVAGSVVTLAALFLPGMRAIEDAGSPVGTAQPEAVPDTSPPAVDERRAA